jgi:hypothetical protein
MRILITGGTGFIGSSLCRKLLESNHALVVLSRKPETVAEKCGAGVKAIGSIDELDSNEPIDAVFNLAGEPIVAKRWSDARKQELLASRIDVTQAIVDFISRAQMKPACLVSGSAIGYYGDRGDETLNEESSFHDEFAHQLCQQWEDCARQAEQQGVRVCLVRTGLVVDQGGGFLQKMLLPFKLGLGGPIGSGNQWMSWIHRDDMVRLLIWLLENESAKGIYNATAPKPVTNREFAQTLGKSLHRPAVIPMPAFVLNTAMGEMAHLLLTGQKVMPAKALQSGFEFQYPDLTGALEQVLGSA